MKPGKRCHDLFLKVSQLDIRAMPCAKKSSARVSSSALQRSVPLA